MLCATGAEEEVEKASLRFVDRRRVGAMRRHVAKVGGDLRQVHCFRIDCLCSGVD